MNRLHLKLLLCVSMLADHIALLFFSPGATIYVAFRSLGRMALPLACYLLVEGYYHCAKKSRYAFRLGVFAIFSEIPYAYLALRQRLHVVEYCKAQGVSSFAELTAEQQELCADRILPLLNILFTLLLCLGMLCCLDAVRRRIEKKGMQMVCLTLSVGVTLLVACLLQMDSWMLAPIYVLAFCYFRQDKGAQLVVAVMVAVVYAGSVPYAIGSLLAIAAVRQYNEKLGYGQRRKLLIQYAFYLFYPLHLAVLLLLRYGLF